MSSKSGYIELLKDEHIQMHAKLIELQRRYDILEASILKGNEEREFSKGSFIHRVVSAIANLYKNGLYRWYLSGGGCDHVIFYPLGEPIKCTLEMSGQMQITS
ncbi:unnamed protein product [Dracunculus medinensis]|uniref:Uncharacterized protein n=1 Tax=Dracunculus medinensis TaxID=318479 RepID=A0A0N4UFJ4_DRAME|nr:unnamed protein product [Dracunculus medinensis]